MLFCVCAVNLDSCERMSIKIDSYTWEIGHINHMDQIRLAGLDMYSIVLAVVDQS
jgi:hypothetical protein